MEKKVRKADGGKIKMCYQTARLKFSGLCFTVLIERFELGYVMS